MKFQVEWDNPEKTIIRVTYPEKWTWNDFFESMVEETALMRTVQHTVHLLVDLRQSKSIPVGGALTHSRNALNDLPDNWGILAVVSTNVLIQRLATVFRTAFTNRIGAKTFVVASMDEAYRLIAQKESGTASS